MRVTAEWIAEASYQGKWPRFSGIGGYTLLYLDAKNGDYLCATCAREAWESDEHDVELHLDIYYEGPVLYCDGCNAEIESSYGDPEEDDSDDDATNKEGSST